MISFYSHQSLQNSKCIQMLYLGCCFQKEHKKIVVVPWISSKELLSSPFILWWTVANIFSVHCIKATWWIIKVLIVSYHFCLIFRCLTLPGLFLRYSQYTCIHVYQSMLSSPNLFMCLTTITHSAPLFEIWALLEKKTDQKVAQDYINVKVKVKIM